MAKMIGLCYSPLWTGVSDMYQTEQTAKKEVEGNAHITIYSSLNKIMYPFTLQLVPSEHVVDQCYIIMNSS